jgi:peptidase C39-like protein/FG-GAP repeat protein
MKKYIIILTMAFIVVLAGSLPALAGILPVPMIYQTQNQWCWAGSCQMILSYYGTATAQCTMANYCFGLSYCCSSPSSTSCNQPNWIFGYGKDMAEVLSHYGSISGTGYNSYLGWSTLVSEIDGGHPFVIGFSWTGGGGHAMVGRGYSGNNVYYNDPWDGYMYASYTWMKSSSDSSAHVWDQSYTTRSSGGSSNYRVLAGGDYNGDGYSDIAIFRPSSGLWLVRGVTRVYWGTSGDIPVPGNYGGYGKTDIGIYRPASGLWALQGYLRYYYGSSSDTPVPGDYTGNGACNLGIFRPSTGLWSVRGVTRVYWGTSGDIPVPANYGGYGKTDIGIFRPSSGLWALQGYIRYYFGQSGDIPVTR